MQSPYSYRVGELRIYSRLGSSFALELQAAAPLRYSWTSSTTDVCSKMYVSLSGMLSFRCACVNVHLYTGVFGCDV